MINIKKEKDGSYTIEGLKEDELMTLYIMTQVCYQQQVAKEDLSKVAFGFGQIIEDFFQVQRGEKIRYLP